MSRQRCTAWIHKLSAAGSGHGHRGPAQAESDTAALNEIIDLLWRGHIPQRVLRAGGTVHVVAEDVGGRETGARKDREQKLAMTRAGPGDTYERACSHPAVRAVPGPCVFSRTVLQQEIASHVSKSHLVDEVEPNLGWHHVPENVFLD